MPKSRRRIERSVRLLPQLTFRSDRFFVFKSLLWLFTPIKTGHQELMKPLNVSAIVITFNTGFSISSTYIVVSKAFQLLSGMNYIFDCRLQFSPSFTDPQKRAVFDSGTDPDDRFGGMSSRASGFPNSFGNGRFEGELSPEDLFNMFFGGNGANAFGSNFGAGPSVSTFRNLYHLGLLILPPSCFLFWFRRLPYSNI
jgi:hypothetical protein